ncbi:MAG: glycosyltransferase family 4 protein [Planctomycetota bacterium]|nr:glycosyltransferase family 4 protein [Planctomycetota bacterium]
MRLLMVSGDRQVSIGEKGPFDSMQEEFSRHFERIDVLCPNPGKPQTVQVLHDRVHLHPAPCGRAGMPRWIAETGRALIAQHGHAVITSHDYGWFYNGLGSAALSRATGVPYLSEIHHVPGYPFAVDWREHRDRWIARAYLRYARHRAAGFRVVNQKQMPDLLMRWGVDPARILVLPSLYLDLETFQPGEEAADRPFDLCFVGRMVPNKGVPLLLKAMEILKGEGLDLSAILVGKGPERERWQREAQASGLRTEWVEWLAEPSDLAAVYRSSRLVVCASSCEGGPRFTVEAMACGTPVVSTPVGVMGDLLADGRCGRLSGFDAWSLAAALRACLEDEESRRAMGREAAQRAQPFERARAIRVYAEGVQALAR